MSNNISITIDIISKLKKIYEGKTFSDSLVVITELLQNSQRAGAKKVNIELGEGKLVFKDDGCGCKDPNYLYKLDYSNWESTNEGFGIGLWSWLAVEGVEGIEINSHNWKTTLYTKNIFENNDLESKIETLSTKIKGFEVTIFSDTFSSNVEEITNRIYSDGEMQVFDVYFNDVIIPKKDLHGEVKGQFKKHFSNRLFEATLAARNSWTSPIVYYERRMVDNFSPGEYMSGVIEVKNNALTLQEPDRKNVIRDKKRETFINKLYECRKELYLDIVKDGDSASIDEYAHEISRVLNVEDYEKYIFVDDLLLEVEEETRSIGDINPTCKANSFQRLVEAIENINNNTQLSLTSNRSEEDLQKKIETLLNNSSDTHKWVKTNMYSDEVDSDINHMDLTENMLEESNSILVGQVVYKKVNVSEYKEMFEEDDEDITSSITVKATRKTIKKDTLKSVIKKINKKVWVKASEVQEYTNLIAKIEYYGVKVFIARNILHENVFEANNVSYITQIESGIQKRNIKWDVELKTRKEERFIELLQPICYYYNLAINTFKIGYLKLLVETTLDGKIINREIIENTKNRISIYGVSEDYNIVLDRRALGLQRFNLSGSNIGVNEFKALMASLKTISHELAHLIYGTEDNTADHRVREDAIYEELVNLYLSI